MSSEPIFNHETRAIGAKVLERIKCLKVGQKMQDLPEELWHDSFYYYMKVDPNRKGGPNLRLIRLDPSQPSLTVTGYIFNKFVHPFEDRFITPREAARLQGFPDELAFQGSLTQIHQQIGDAVPIELGRTLFTHLLNWLEKNKKIFAPYNALSLFSGAGGLDVAASQAFGKLGSQFKIVGCVELEPSRCATLRGYFTQNTPILQHDIRQLSTAHLLTQCAVTAQEITLIYGGPPCQTFSQAGKQQGRNDPRGELIFEFLRVVKEINPPLFLMENVPNLKAIADGRLMRDILGVIESMNYDVQWQILHAAEYGCAQKRQRLIFLGTRRAFGNSVNIPEPTHTNTPNLFNKPLYKTVGDAFMGLPEAQPFTEK
jgi:DNA (cytosine-5)-methyltransferase 1